MSYTEAYQYLRPIIPLVQKSDENYGPVKWLMARVLNAKGKEEKRHQDIVTAKQKFLEVKKILTTDTIKINQSLKQLETDLAR